MRKQAMTFFIDVLPLSVGLGLPVVLLVVLLVAILVVELVLALALEVEVMLLMKGIRMNNHGCDQFFFLIIIVIIIIIVIVIVVEIVSIYFWCGRLLDLARVGSLTRETI